jgi:hypothetical protein
MKISSRLLAISLFSLICAVSTASFADVPQPR